MTSTASPVDYLSRDTIKRVLGERLVPPLTQWERTKTPNSSKFKYKLILEGRVYTITPFRVLDSNKRQALIHGGYRVAVRLDHGTDFLYLDKGGHGHGRPMQGDWELYLINALETVNMHLYRYPP